MPAVILKIRCITELCLKLKRIKQRNIIIIVSVSLLVIFILTISLIFTTPAALYSSKDIDNKSDNKNDDSLKQKEALYVGSVKSAENKAMELIKEGNGVFLYEKGCEENNVEFVEAGLNMQEPPKLVVKAIIRTSDKISACVDIDEVADGIMMMSGVSFLGHGKILAINDNSIEWEWKGKNYKTEF